MDKRSRCLLQSNFTSGGEIWFFLREEVIRIKEKGIRVEG